MKCVIDAMLLTELHLLDVASQSTAQAIKLKAIIPFFVVRHRLNLFPMLQLSQATLSVNAFMAFTNMSFAMLVNPVIGLFLSACKKIPFVGWIVAQFFKNVTSVFKIQQFGNTMIDAFSLKASAYSADTADAQAVFVVVCIWVCLCLGFCYSLSYSKHAQVLDCVKSNFTAVLCHSHRPTLLLAASVWTFLALFVVLARPFSFFSELNPAVATDI